MATHLKFSNSKFIRFAIFAAAACPACVLPLPAQTNSSPDAETAKRIQKIDEGRFLGHISAL